MKKAYPLVIILWLDAEADNSWKTESEVQKEDTGELCVTVGLLIKKPTRRVPVYIVAGTATKNEKPHFNNTMKIPDSWVKELTILKEEYVIFESD